MSGASGSWNETPGVFDSGPVVLTGLQKVDPGSLIPGDRAVWEFHVGVTILRAFSDARILSWAQTALASTDPHVTIDATRVDRNTGFVYLWGTSQSVASAQGPSEAGINPLLVITVVLGVASALAAAATLFAVYKITPGGVDSIASSPLSGVVAAAKTFGTGAVFGIAAAALAAVYFLFGRK